MILMRSWIGITNTPFASSAAQFYFAKWISSKKDLLATSRRNSSRLTFPFSAWLAWIMNRAFEKSLWWWWGGLVLRCILLASPIRSRWLKYFSNSFCSQQIWFCTLKGFTRKKLEIQLFKPFVARHCKKHEQISVPWKLICQYKNEKDLAQQFANRETEAQKRLWFIIHHSEQSMFCFGESRSWRPARKSWKYEVLGQVPYFSQTANI